MKLNKAILLIVTLALLGACQTNNSKSADKSGAINQLSENSFELALITDTGSIDDNSFNHGCWQGIMQYSRERFVPHKYYQPEGHAISDLLAAIDLAVKDGAKIIITPSVTFENTVFMAQERYPNVNFILVDGIPHSGAGDSSYKTGSNTSCVLFAEDQAGFLAGYAAVMDGYRTLGFFGGELIPPVNRFGCGFIQGVEFAAETLALAPGSVTMNYIYTGSFLPSPEAQDLAASWYESGTEIIFACGGAIGKSVIAAAEKAGKKVIGVDVDQSRDSETVVTSAMKGLQSAVYTSIVNYYNGRFPGGRMQVFCAANRGIGLPMQNSRFQHFNISEYNAIYQKMINGDIPRIEKLDNTGSPTVIPISIIKVNYLPTPSWPAKNQD
ncbi:MAG: BMP family ABC transporter substrate-binding protein [Treponema sp.]|jgi:basic membrane protein A|nr:BMP family ABC transporter substrate-binding protein [Treponema sp.]